MTPNPFPRVFCQEVPRKNSIVKDALSKFGMIVLHGRFCNTDGPQPSGCISALGLSVSILPTRCLFKDAPLFSDT